LAANLGPGKLRAPRHAPRMQAQEMSATETTHRAPTPVTNDQRRLHLQLDLPPIESYLCADTILRGLVDAGDYRQVIFPLVFYKRLSDDWDEDYSNGLVTYDGSAELANADADERFVIPGARTGATRAPWSKDSGSRSFSASDLG
jgi:hypothetical protein